MHIKTKLRQHRRDFTALYACETCGHEEEYPGYDDAFFHERVIPNMECPECGLKGGGPATSPDVPAGVTL